MLSYHGLAHLRPFFRPKVFCCLRRPRHQYAPGSPSPLYVALPAPNAPWLPKSMAAFDEHLEGVHSTNATHSVPSRFGGASDLRSRKGAVSARSPHHCPATQRTMCVSVSDTPGEQWLTTSPYECGPVGNSGLGNDGQVIVRYENPLQAGKAMLPLCLPFGCSGPADDQGCWDHRLAFVDPNTTKGREANFLIDITSNEGATDAVLFRFMTCQECAPGSFDSYSQNLHLHGTTREENTATDETVK